MAIEGKNIVGPSGIPIEVISGWRVGGERVKCNTGGPMSRARLFSLKSSVLGSNSGPISCPKLRTVALDFGREDPVPFVRRLLDRLGYASPEAAKAALLPRTERCICCPLSATYRTRVRNTRPETVLEKALVLGLSTPSVFDPARPVVWTRASLTRRLALYDFRGFYND
jgi:hypothetical protein